MTNNKRMTGSEASNYTRQKSSESSRKGKSRGSGIKTRNLSGEEEDKKSNSTSTTETKNKSGRNGRSKGTRNRTRKNSEEEEDEESNRTLFTEEKNVTGGKFGKRSKSIKQSQEDEDKDEDDDEDEDEDSFRTLFAKENEKPDGHVRRNHTGNRTRYLKEKNRKSLSRGFPSALVLGAVVVPLVIITVCAGSLDCSVFYDLFKAAIKESFSGLHYIFDLITASTSTGLCNLKAFIKEILDWITASTNTGFCDPHKNKSCDEFLHEKFNNLKLKYSDQSSDTWLTLYAAAYDHVSYPPSPKRPIVIMVYRLKNGSKGTEILEDIAEAYDSVLPPQKNNGNITIKGESFTNSSPEETQKQIQDMLEKGFEIEAQKVAIVYDFDKLPSCSVLTFHNYCNNEDAPHKNVAIILTITGGDEMLPSNPKSPDLEAAVGKLFHEKWKDCPKELPPGKIDAMLSRVANNVILLR